LKQWEAAAQEYFEGAGGFSPPIQEYFGAIEQMKGGGSSYGHGIMIDLVMRRCLPCIHD
jgi:hypothetical protein